MTPRHLIVVLTIALLTECLGITLQGGTQYDHLDLVDAKGNIRKPADYRDRYQALGVYTVLDPAGNEMHYTYATPGTAEFYRRQTVAGGTRAREKKFRHESRGSHRRRHWAKTKIIGS